MLAKEESSDGPVRPNEQTDIRSGDLPIHGGIRSEGIYLDVLLNMMEVCDDKEPKDPKTDDEWRAYWAGSRCSYQHCYDLFLSLKSKEQDDDEHPTD